ncbi:hypothetical protein IFO68_00880 [Photobacterium sp. CAU 1568]|uniref:Uncharacterized protein n=1 Tax=Photobacterium arenosum TaxID=2774143 RepID=A0ABR9BGB0_9GAMM|nr:hypothetical protein [Photobacterium arenosum]
MTFVMKVVCGILVSAVSTPECGYRMHVTCYV